MQGLQKKKQCQIDHPQTAFCQYHLEQIRTWYGLVFAKSAMPRMKYQGQRKNYLPKYLRCVRLFRCERHHHILHLAPIQSCAIFDNQIEAVKIIVLRFSSSLGSHQRNYYPSDGQNHSFSIGPQILIARIFFGVTIKLNK